MMVVDIEKEREKNRAIACKHLDHHQHEIYIFFLLRKAAVIQEKQEETKKKLHD